MRWTLGAVLGMVFAGFGVILAGLLGIPLLRFMWSLKSKSLAAEGSFATPVFLSETYVHSSQDYPTCS